MPTRLRYPMPDFFRDALNTRNHATETAEPDAR